MLAHVSIRSPIVITEGCCKCCLSMGKRCSDYPKVQLSAADQTLNPSCEPTGEALNLQEQSHSVFMHTFQTCFCRRDGAAQCKFMAPAAGHLLLTVSHMTHQERMRHCSHAGRLAAATTNQKSRWCCTLGRLGTGRMRA